MKMNGRTIDNKKPLDALNHSMSYVPAERKTEGVNLVMSVKENITLSNLRGLVKKGRLDLKYEKSIAENWVKKLSVKTPSVETYADNLSGGNQQKLVIAKCLNTEPKFMILNEPTRGIDVGAKVEIYDLINDLCKSGKAVLMISSELPEIMSMSDRIYVMCEGRITGEVERQEYSQEGLLKLAIGEC
jgi:ABC-type sugar transport system ATPase subunit